MCAKRKRITRDEFKPIANRNWVPVVLLGDGRPKWMANIPDEKLRLILASGTFVDPKLVETNGMTFSDVVGGIDIYRYDKNDEPKGYPINMDHYLILLDSATEDAFLVLDDKDSHSWLSKLPSLPDSIEIIDTIEKGEE